MERPPDPLEQFMQRRAAERLAAIVTPEHAPAMKHERKQAPVVEMKPQPQRVASENELKPVPFQRGPSMGPGFTSSTAIRVDAARTKQAEKLAQEAGAAILTEKPHAHKLDPLQAFMEKRKAEGRDEVPAERLARTLKLSM